MTPVVVTPPTHPDDDHGEERTQLQSHGDEHASAVHSPLHRRLACRRREASRRGIDLMVAGKIAKWNEDQVDIEENQVASGVWASTATHLDRGWDGAAKCTRFDHDWIQRCTRPAGCKRFSFFFSSFSFVFC